MRWIIAWVLMAAMGSAVAAEVAGVKLEDKVSIQPGGPELVLNGAGLRTKTFLKVKVYVAALYVTERSKDPVAIVTLDAPKTVRLTLMRDVDRASFVGSLRDGFAANSPSQAQALA